MAVMQAGYQHFPIETVDSGRCAYQGHRAFVAADENDFIACDSHGLSGALICVGGVDHRVEKDVFCQQFFFSTTGVAKDGGGKY